MFMAVMRQNYEDVVDNLLKIPDSANGGSNGHNALHAAVRNGANSGDSETYGKSGKLMKFNTIQHNLVMTTVFMFITLVITARALIFLQ